VKLHSRLIPRQRLSRVGLNLIPRSDAALAEVWDLRAKSVSAVYSKEISDRWHVEYVHDRGLRQCLTKPVNVDSYCIISDVNVWSGSLPEHRALPRRVEGGGKIPLHFEGGDLSPELGIRISEPPYHQDLAARDRYVNIDIYRQENVRAVNVDEMTVIVPLLTISADPWYMSHTGTSRSCSLLEGSIE
jgi:hypothetical protein